jgi:hypothetical protein
VQAAAVMEQGTGLWYNVREPQRIGLPAPISTLLAGLAGDTLFDRARTEEAKGA